MIKTIQKFIFDFIGINIKINFGLLGLNKLGIKL